jgi:glycine/D-amino acid oxidase-like deaminating enzyme
MSQLLERFSTNDTLPKETDVVIIGGGIVGVSAALTLAERGIPVVLIEKGHIACEQSSRNLGWIRKTSRHKADIPLAQAADRLWHAMPERVGQSVGYKASGIMFLAKTEMQLEAHRQWIASVDGMDLDSRLLTPSDIDHLVPGGKGDWLGGVYTPSDGRAEPTLATAAMAKKAMALGATLIQHCAVRTLSLSAGRVAGVVTEQGEIRCKEVLLAGGAWSRRFLGNLGFNLPTLPLICSALRTTPMEGPTDISVGGPDFSFRKHKDGGFIITQRGKLDAPFLLDHLLIGHRYLDQLKTQRDFLKIGFGKPFFKDLALSRRWNEDQKAPYEKVRINNPSANASLNQDALNNLSRAWPSFASAQIEEAWAGLIDVTPDSNPVIDRVDSVPGLTIATGFSGHGFGTGPAAGALAADLATQNTPIVDPSPYSFARL